MKNLHEIYRLFELNRLVYMAGGPPEARPAGPEAETAEPKADETTDESTQDHSEAIKTHRENCHKHVDSVVEEYKDGEHKKAAQTYAETVKTEIKKHFDQLKQEYNDAKDVAEETTDEEENEALVEINQRAEKLAEDIQKRINSEHKKSIENEGGKETGVDELSTESEVDEDLDESAEATPKAAKEAFINDLFENRDLRFRIVRSVQPNRNPEQVTPEEFTGLVDGSPMGKALEEFIKKLDQADQEKLANGELALTAEHRNSIRKAISENYDTIDENDKLPNAQEVEWIMEFQLGDSEQSFGEKYGKHAAEILSMDFDFKMEDGGLQYTENGKDYKAVTQTGLEGYVKDRISKRVPENPNEWQEAKEKNEIMKRAIQLRDAFRDNPEAAERMGIMEYITAAMQLYAMFKEAIESGDPEALNALSDAMNDFGKGENPAKKMTEAREKYGEEISKINDIESLLKMYGSPTGPEANRVFGSGNDKVPYRLFLKDAIKGQLESSLKVEITNMESLSGGKNNSKINCTRNGESYQIYLYEDSGRVTARVEKTGSEAVAEEKAVEELAGDANNSLESLFNSFVASSAKAPEKPEEKGNEKEENEEGEKESEEEEAAKEGAEESEDTEEAEEEETAEAEEE
jgi:hypothetical protein